MKGQFVTWGKAWHVIGDKHFEIVKEFLYPGSLITPMNDVSLEIQRRSQTANKCSKICSRASFTPDKIHHSQDLDPPSPVKRGC
jgi:hypothetical protein